MSNTHTQEAGGKPSVSGFDADFRCLGKFALERKLPEEPDTPIQKRGMGIHKALETSDLSELNASDQITASRCMYAEAELVHEHGFEGAETVWEQRLWDNGEDLEPQWSGQLDVVHFEAKKQRAMLNDHKTGWGIPQPIATNWQIRGQAVLVALEYPVKEIVAALIHPHHPDSLYETKVFGVEEIEVNLVTIRRFVALIQRDDQPRTPNSVSCHFCRAKNICPEYQAKNAALAQAVADEKEDKGYTAIIRRTPAERGEHVGELKALAKYVEQQLEQYTELAKKDETAIEHYRLIRAYNRVVPNEGAALVAIERAFGKDAVRESMQFSLTALQDYLERSKKIGKKEAKSRVEKALVGLGLLKFKPKEPSLKESRS